MEDRGDCLLCSHFVVSDCLWHGIWRRFYSQARWAGCSVQSAANYGCAHFDNAKKDQKAFRTITQMIEASRPDIIVVTGDITSEDENMRAFRTFGEFMESFKIPWGFVYGNHDAETRRTHTKTQLSEYLESLEYCFFDRGPEDVDGEGNYYYNVTDDSGKIIMSLMMMDSNMYYRDPVTGQDDGYDCFP